MAQDRQHEAAGVLQKYHAGITDPEAELSPLVAAELAEIQEAIRMQQDANQVGWSALFSTPGLCYPVYNRIHFTDSLQGTGNELSSPSRLAALPSGMALVLSHIS